VGGAEDHVELAAVQLGRSLRHRRRLLKTRKFQKELP
jgi:hypothetical protein